MGTSMTVGRRDSTATSRGPCARSPTSANLVTLRTAGASESGEVRAVGLAVTIEELAAVAGAVAGRPASRRSCRARRCSSPRTRRAGRAPRRSEAPQSWALMPPSPTSATTTRSGHASCTPSAAAGPKPIVDAPPGSDEAAPVAHGIPLGDAVLVPPDVGHEDGVLGARCRRRSRGCAPGAAGRRRSAPRSSVSAKRSRRVLPIRLEQARPGRRRPLPRAPARASIAMRGRGPTSATAPMADGVVAADLGGVEVDLHEPAGRELPGVVPLPRTGVGLGEPRPERQDEVGGPRVLVGELQPPEARHAQQRAGGRRTPRSSP